MRFDTRSGRHNRTLVVVLMALVAVLVPGLVGAAQRTVLGEYFTNLA